MVSTSTCFLLLTAFQSTSNGTWHEGEANLQQGKILAGLPLHAGAQGGTSLFKCSTILNGVSYSTISTFSTSKYVSLVCALFIGKNRQQNKAIKP